MQVPELQPEARILLDHGIDIERDVIVQCGSVHSENGEVETLRPRQETKAENQRRYHGNAVAAQNKEIREVLELQSPAIVTVPHVAELHAGGAVVYTCGNQGVNNILANTRRRNLYRARRRARTEINRNPAGHIDNIQEHYGGDLSELCRHCNAAHFVSEEASNMRNSFHDCCSHGIVHLEPLPAMPDELRSLFDRLHEKSKDFFERIRNYNSSFSFASFNANLMDFEGPGPYCFKIQG